MLTRTWGKHIHFVSWVAGLALTLLAAAPAATAAKPITIGFDIDESGGLAVNGKASLRAFQIWARHVNEKVVCSVGL